jgi:glycosyltransferase involved in cell wall biosynthesis
MRTKLCIVVSDVDTSHLIETMGRALDPARYEVTFVFMGDTEPSLYRKLAAEGFAARFVRCRGKRDLPAATLALARLFGELKPDVVHTHLVNASLAGLAAAKLKGVGRRVHTRHHSVETHHDYPHGVYYDRVINRLSTHVVAISRVVFDVLTKMEGVAPGKVTVIHHGFELERFRADESLVGEIKSKYGLEDRYPVVGVISRHIHWKGVQYVVPAFKELSRKYPNAKLVLANALGPHKPEVEKLLGELDPSQYVQVEFEKRVFELYRTFDVFVHVPVGREYEAFGQVYVEALAMRVPSVFTLSGVANDFIEDGRNALVVPYRDASAVTRAVETLLNDEDLRRRLTTNGREAVLELFPESRMAAELDAMYTRAAAPRESTAAA